MRTGWIAAAAAMTMTMAACGSSAKSEEATASAAAASTTAAAPAAATATDQSDTTAAVAATEPAATDPAGTETTDAAAPDDTGTVDYVFTGDGGDEFCALSRELDQSDPLDSAFSGTTPEEVKAGWAEATKAFERLNAAAPDEIADDVALATSFFAKLGKVMEDNDFDMLKVGEAMQANPELAALLDGQNADVEAASARLDAYGVQVCGLSS